VKLAPKPQGVYPISALESETLGFPEKFKHAFSHIREKIDSKRKNIA